MFESHFFCFKKRSSIFLSSWLLFYILGLDQIHFFQIQHKQSKNHRLKIDFVFVNFKKIRTNIIIMTNILRSVSGWIEVESIILIGLKRTLSKNNQAVSIERINYTKSILLNRIHFETSILVTMSSHLWPKIEVSKINPSWFRPLQPGEFFDVILLSTLFFFPSVTLVREDLSLSKFEELLEQERRRYTEKGEKIYESISMMFISPFNWTLKVWIYRFMVKLRWTMPTWVFCWPQNRSVIFSKLLFSFTFMTNSMIRMMKMLTKLKKKVKEQKPMMIWMLSKELVHPITVPLLQP